MIPVWLRFPLATLGLGLCVGFIIGVIVGIAAVR